MEATQSLEHAVQEVHEADLGKEKEIRKTAGPLHFSYNIECERCHTRSPHYYLRRQYIQKLLDDEGWEYVPLYGWLCRSCVPSYFQAKATGGLLRPSPAPTALPLPLPPATQVVHTDGQRRCVGCGRSLEGAHRWRIRCETCAAKRKKDYGTQYSLHKRRGIIPKRERKRKEKVTEEVM